MLTDHTPDTLRTFERDVAARFNAGDIRAPVHLQSNCEEQLIDIFRDVSAHDWVCCSWRSHLHCLLKGVPPSSLMADIVAGKSIALCYPEYRIISSAIVGGILPIALGLAWSIKREGSSEHVWCFAGDMTAETGVFYECYKYAARQDLLITFVVENNEMSVCTVTEEVWGKNIFEAKNTGFINYTYKNPWPHAGAGQRVQF